MRILVLGGTGFIGPCVIRDLVAEDHQVAVFTRGRRQPDLPGGVRTVSGDYKQLHDFRGPFRALFHGDPPEVVLDMIPMTEQDARNLIRTFDGIARRIVAVSSQDVYRAWGYVVGLEGQLTDPHITEDSPLRESRYPYRGRKLPIESGWDMDNYEKVVVERVFQLESALPATILRLPMVYGPGDYAHRAFPYLKRMDDGRPAILMEEPAARWRAPWGYVEDVAAAVALAATREAAAGRIYNVAEQDNRSTAEFIAAIAEAVAWNGRVVELPQGAFPGPWSAYRMEQHILTDSTRIRRELGYRETVPRAEAMGRTIEWERAHPPDPFPKELFDYAAEDLALECYHGQEAAGRPL
jgi:nucleoside-diphosphate-sugar epimerase